MSRVTQLGFLALGLLRQPRIRMRRGRMRFVRPLLPVKVHRRIAAAFLGRFALAIFSFETLRSRPRLQQRPVHREVFVTSSPCARIFSTTPSKNAAAISPSSKRSRFLLNTVGTHTASSMFSPTNQRNNRL